MPICKYHSLHCQRRLKVGCISLQVKFYHNEGKCKKKNIYMEEFFFPSSIEWMLAPQYVAWTCSHSPPGHQLQDISEAASLFRRVRIGDQPNSDWASSAWWKRPVRQPCLEACFRAHVRGLGFIWKQTEQKWVKKPLQHTVSNVVPRNSWKEETGNTFQTLCVRKGDLGWHLLHYKKLNMYVLHYCTIGKLRIWHIVNWAPLGQLYSKNVGICSWQWSTT